MNARRSTRRNRHELRARLVLLLEIYEFMQNHVNRRNPDSINPERAFLPDLDRDALQFFDQSGRSGDSAADTTFAKPGEIVRSMEEVVKQILRGVQSDIAERHLIGETALSTLPQAYKSAFSRDLFADAGDPIGEVKALLRRGYLDSEDEAILLNDVLSDHAELLTATQLPEAERLVAEFNDTQKWCNSNN